MVDKKFNYLYKITNLINNKFYIGVHSTNNLEDGYMGSGVALHKAYEKYGIDNFKKEILQFTDTREELMKLEESVVDENFLKRQDTYNEHLGGYGGQPKGELSSWWGRKHTEEWKKQSSERQKGKHLSEETKQKIGAKSKGRQSFLGKTHSDETRQKIRESRKGMSPGNKGKHKIWDNEEHTKFHYG